MRKIYLLVSLMAIFALTLASTVKAQYNTAFVVNVDPLGLGSTYLPGVNPVYGEALYKDLNLPGTTGTAKVSAGDVRLTPVSDGAGGWYAAGTTVVAGDADINIVTYGAAARWGTIKHRDTGATASRYDFGEFIYKDADASGTVTAGDTRYSNVPGYKVSSVVVASDTDIGGALVIFQGMLTGVFERFTDNLAANTAYDFARLFVDIYWTTDIPDNTPFGMRGYQFFCAVDPNVLTPLGWIGATSGYVLMDFLGSVGSSLTTAIVGSVNTVQLDVSEQILGALDPPTGAGDLWSYGKLITLIFIPQSLTQHSPLDLLATSLGYQDAGTELWHTVTLTDGHYNEPIAPEFPFGVSVLVALVPMIPIIYVWRTRPKRKVA